MEKRPWRNEDLMRELYIDKEMTTYEIEDKLNCSRRTVSKWLDNFNITIRDNTGGDWTNKELLEELYIDEDMDTYEIADQLDCTPTTIIRWLDEFGIEKEYKNERLLRELYIGNDMSSHEIASELGCAQATIIRWLNKFDIEVRESPCEKPPHFRTYNGYELLHHHDGDKHRTIRLHRLVAVAEYGFDAVVDKHVHHKNHIPWDNRTGNLIPLTPSEHAQYHAKERV